LEIQNKNTTTYLNLTSIFLLFLLIIKLVYIYINYGYSEYVQIIPDDAFYYLQIAKNWSIKGIWTFDGTNLASGFHPLHAYFLGIIYKIQPEIQLKEIFFICSSIYIISYVYSYFQISKIIFPHLKNKSNLIFCFITWISTASLTMPFMLMEGWIPLICTSIFIKLLFDTSKDHKKTNFIIPTIGMLGILGRLDFIVFSISLFMAWAIIVYKKVNKKNHEIILLRMKKFFLGNILGVIFLIIHNFLNFERFIQSSAEIKSFWVSQQGYDFKSILVFIPKLFLPTEFNSVLAYLIIFIFFSITTFVFIKYLFNNNANLKILTLYISSYFLIFLYIIAFTRSGGNAYWYMVPFIIPSSIAITFAIDEFILKKKYFLNFSLIAFFTILSSTNLFFKSYPLQKDIYIKTFEISKKNYKKIGSWNSGIVSYFTRGVKVINLDGLVNDSIVKNIKNNNTNNYIKNENLEALVDYPSTLREKHLGINFKEIKSCISNKEALYEQKFEIFEIKENCL